MSNFKSLMAAKNQHIEVSKQIERVETNITDETAIAVTNAEPQVMQDNTEPKALPSSENESTAEEERKSPEKTRKAINLTHEINRFVRMRAKREGYSITEYLDMIVEEAKKDYEAQYPGEDLYYSIYEQCRIPALSSTKERTTIDITKENLDYLTMLCQQSGITFTQLLNRFLYDKMQKES